MNREELNLGRNDDPLDEPWIQPQYRRPFQDDDDAVTVIPADEVPVGRAVAERMVRAEREVATLRHAPNADDHHNMGISNLRTALETAINFLSVPRTGAKAWAADLAYRDEILPHIRVAVEEVTQALNIIDIHEQ